MQTNEHSSKVSTNPLCTENFDTVLAKVITDSTTTVEQGSAFERLMRNYFHYHPKYQASEVWLWSAFPYKDTISGKDIGIDLVMRKEDGSFAAIQCKCFDEGTTIDKSHVDTFLSTAARDFSVGGEKKTFDERYWVSTTDKYTNEANGTLDGQKDRVIRLDRAYLRAERVDWEKVLRGDKDITLPTEIRPYQTTAVEKVVTHFKDHDRGRLIMACGTGKTFTSLKIAQEQTNGEGRILVLVPSIGLISQTLEVWTTEKPFTVRHICVCSDSQADHSAKKRADEDEMDEDPPFSATTNKKTLVERLLKVWGKRGLKVVFSTYHSIGVVAEAQQELLTAGLDGAFDLIICDEAHRTTGASEKDKGDSYFVKVHDGRFIRGKKRLYMTATPRLYAANVKKKAEENDIEVYSMDDEGKYGQEIYRFGFSEAVEQGYLSDYTVLIFGLNAGVVPQRVQDMVRKAQAEEAKAKGKAGDTEEAVIAADDYSKIAGCFSAFSYRGKEDEVGQPTRSFDPMRRVVAFGENIKKSKVIAGLFEAVSKAYAADATKQRLVQVGARHVDGSMGSSTRNGHLNWLRAEQTAHDTCRVLSNVRCLGEGIDVPALDAVAFLAAKQSEIGIVQAVGRVMRKSRGKFADF